MNKKLGVNLKALTMKKSIFKENQKYFFSDYFEMI